MPKKSKESLKSKNTKYIVSLCVVDALIMGSLLFHRETLATSTFKDLAPEIAKSGSIAGAFSLLGLVLAHLFSSDVKEILVFWRTKDVLPGHRAFSYYLQSDPRIDVAELTKKHKKLPTDPREQNALWYRFLKIHEKQPEVEQAHQMFLLFRDLAAISFLAAIVVPLGSILLHLAVKDVLMTDAVLAVQFFLFMISARNSSSRLVTTVLALESGKKVISTQKKRPTGQSG